MSKQRATFLLRFTISFPLVFPKPVLPHSHTLLCAVLGVSNSFSSPSRRPSRPPEHGTQGKAAHLCVVGLNVVSKSNVSFSFLLSLFFSLIFFFHFYLSTFFFFVVFIFLLSFVFVSFPFFIFSSLSSFFIIFLPSFHSSFFLFIFLPFLSPFVFLSYLLFILLF